MLSMWGMPRLRFTGLTAGLAAMVMAMAACACISPAQAIEPGERLDDPKLESRARKLSAELRCLVCQNQSIDDSNAELAKDLRVLVRERIQAGDSDREVIDYVVSRYGEFVLLRPPFNVRTLLLWLAPLLVLVGAVAYAIMAMRRAQSQSAAATPGRTADALSAQERERLEKLLDDAKS